MPDGVKSGKRDNDLIKRSGPAYGLLSRKVDYPRQLKKW